MNRPLAEKSAWLGPRQPGTWTSVTLAGTSRGSANRITSCCSTITTACRPSGVK